MIRLQPTKGVIDALALKLTSFPHVENLRIVLEKCNDVKEHEDPVTTTYVYFTFLLSRSRSSSVHDDWYCGRCIARTSMRISFTNAAVFCKT